MMIKLASIRDSEPLNVAVLEARDAARKYISVASEVLAGSQEKSVIETKLTIVNRRGLHARASAKFVKCAEAYQAEIQVRKDDDVVGATSIMGLMMLGASLGSQIILQQPDPMPKTHWPHSPALSRTSSTSIERRG